MTFIKKFTSSAAELKNVRCIAVTAVLIALDLAIKGLTVTVPMGKISFSFLALASIGMLYGPVVGFFAGTVTDILGLLIANNVGAFNPIYTLSEAAAGLIYGMFLYNIRLARSDFSGARSFMGSLKENRRSVIKIIAAKVCVVFVCNLVISPLGHAVTGYWPQTWDAFFVKWSASAIKNAIKTPVDIMLMFVMLYHVKAAYNAVFKRTKKAENKS